MDREPLILAGDVGGTRTRLGLFDANQLGTAHAIETYRSADFADFSDVVRLFRAAHPERVSAACIGVAGPVRDGRSATVNLPWIVDRRVLEAELQVNAGGVINDLEATAHGIALLSAEDVVTLNAGNPAASGNLAVIAAGTGLGEAGLYWDGKGHHPFPTEGGHAGFGPLDDVDVELFGWLRQRFEHVSWERVVSGQGLVNIYQFLRASGRGDEPAWLREAMAAGDPAAEITKAATAGVAPAVAAVQRFCRLYGAEAGNLALKIMATGGVYIGGGIAPKNIAALQNGGFMQAFLDKGRMRPLLEAIPVKVIMNPLTALHGAARAAAVGLRSAAG